MQTEAVNIGKVIPYARNPRRNDAAISKVAASLQEFGWQQPIVVDADMVVVAGHTRLEAARSLGMTEVPVHVAAGLTPEQVKAYRIADNRVGQEAEWDEELLRLELGELESLEFPLDLTGFDADELGGFMADPIEEGKTDPDEVPELPDDPVTKPGDVWLMGPHRLMCGDSTSIDAVDMLMAGTPADLVFTDPPYGIDYSGGRTQVVKQKTYGRIQNDTLAGADLGGLVTLAFSSTKPGADVYICVSPIMQGPFLAALEENGKEVDAVIVWDKKQPGLGYMAYRRQCEFILFSKGAPFKKGDPSDFDLWQISKDSSSDYLHGTQKPAALPRRAIDNSSKAGEIVLDLFGGSGSTLIAAQMAGRVARLMEIDPKYCDVIVKRWEDFTGNKATLDNSPEAM